MTRPTPHSSASGDDSAWTPPKPSGAALAAFAERADRLARMIGRGRLDPETAFIALTQSWLQLVRSRTLQGSAAGLDPTGGPVALSDATPWKFSPSPLVPSNPRSHMEGERPVPIDDDAPVTALLRAVPDDPRAADALLAVVYDHLRRIANARMASERADHTLQATALVHEAFVKLLGDERIDCNDRAHFYAAAAQAMRRILVDHARRRLSVKRGGDRGRVPLSAVDLAVEADPEHVLALEDALLDLERTDARAASVVRLRFFAGLDVAQTAEALGLSERTVAREWAWARAQLFQHVRDAANDRGDATDSNLDERIR